MSWAEAKTMIEASLGLSQDAMHIYAALVIQLLAAAVVRRSLAHPVPWLVVLAAELANEWFDAHSDNDVIETWELWAALHDVLNTMALPTLLLVVARLAPGLLAGRRAAARGRRR